MSNLPPGAENDVNAPYNKISIDFSIEVEMFASGSADLSEDTDEELFRTMLEETIRESLLKTMREFNVEDINVWVY